MAHKTNIKAVKVTAKPVIKHNSHNGWIPKVTRSTILVCTSCKVKYIKTRPQQVVCIKCMRIPESVKIFRLKQP